MICMAHIEYINFIIEEYLIKQNMDPISDKNIYIVQ